MICARPQSSLQIAFRDRARAESGRPAFIPFDRCAVDTESPRISAKFRNFFYSCSMRTWQPLTSPNFAGPSCRQIAMRGATARGAASRADEKIRLTCEHVNAHVNTSTRQRVKALTRAGLTPRMVVGLQECQQHGATFLYVRP
jgi:hypothetical protein